MLQSLPKCIAQSSLESWFSYLYLLSSWNHIRDSICYSWWSYNHSRPYLVSSIFKYSFLVLNIFTLLCNKSPELFHLGKLKLHNYWIVTLHFPLSPVPDNHHFTLFLSVLLFLMPHISRIIVFATGLFYLVWCFEHSSMWQDFPFSQGGM
jgi:hypothetical protein